MRTITKKIKAYKFDELPEDVQEKVLDKHRYINVEHNWWDGIVDSHIENWKKYGLNANTLPVCFSLDRDNYLYFPSNNLWVEDVKKFAEAINSIVPTKVAQAIKDGDVIVSLDVQYFGGGDGKQIAKFEVYNMMILPEISEELTTWVNTFLLKPLWKELRYEYDEDGDIV
jgi:hypothetical protein